MSIKGTVLELLMPDGMVADWSVLNFLGEYIVALLSATRPDGMGSIYGC